MRMPVVTGMPTWLYRGDDRIEGDAATEALLASRGLAYGDGVFETMRAVAGGIPWWPAHRMRLVEGAARLRMTLPEMTRIETEIETYLHAHQRTHRPDATNDGLVIKLVLMRGNSGRGYAPVAQAMPLWTLSAHPLPAPSSSPVAGLRLRWCELRLASQPALAGIKHCNRLEQVLARAQWSDADVAAFDEGLMRDAEGHAVCATAANLFVYREGGWQTPLIDRCGVKGVCRAWALSALDARECRLSPETVTSADAVFLCNAVRGILPVASLEARRWPSLHPATADALAKLAAAHPAFSHPPSMFENRL